MNKYDVQEIIGEGTYGIVVKALNKETNEIVAIKKFKDNARNFIKRELKMLNSLKSCEFIINLKEAFRRNDKIYFIFEYVERTVLELLAEYPNGISQNICKSITFQLCKAIEKCHSLNIVHRDIKPENLLIDRSYRLKLCDFGFARTSNQENNECFTEYVATRWYRAPELLLVCPYGKPVDIWAIGCLVCEMTIGRPLFEGKSDLDQLQKIKSCLGPIAEFQIDELQKTGKQLNVKIIKSNELFSFERKFSDMNEKLYDFAKRCLTVNPVERLSIDECVKHPALEIQLKVYLNKLSEQEFIPGKNLRPRISEKRGNIKSFKSLMVARNPLQLEKADSYGIEPKENSSRLKSHIAKHQNQIMTPQETGITDIKRNEFLLGSKQTFPLLSNNTTQMNIKKYAFNKQEQLFDHNLDQSLDPTSGENLTVTNSQMTVQKKGQVNRATTMISNYRPNIFQQPMSYQSDVRHKEMKQINYLKLLSNRKEVANLKHRSKSTIETYRTDDKYNEHQALNGSINVHNNQDLTATFTLPFQNHSIFHNLQAHPELTNKNTELKVTPEPPEIRYRYASRKIRVNPNQYLVKHRSLSKNDIMSSLACKVTDDAYNMLTISNIKKSDNREKFTY